jgi:hypothetical protein
MRSRHLFVHLILHFALQFQWILSSSRSDTVPCFHPLAEMELLDGFTILIHQHVTMPLRIFVPGALERTFEH